MTPLKDRSRKRTIRKMRQQERIRIHMSKLVMYGVFLATVAVITPATTPAQAETTAMTPKEMSYTTGQLGKKHLESRNNSQTIITVFDKHHRKATSGIGASPQVVTGTPTTSGVVRSGFGTPTHRRVLFATASARPHCCNADHFRRIGS